MLLKENALRIEFATYGKPTRGNKLRTQKIYTYKCLTCPSEVTSQASHLPRHSGKCVSCAQFNDPFKAAYNELIRSCTRRKHAVSLSYEQFVTFTKIPNCHYCLTRIAWEPHTKRNGKDVPGSRSYKLDRMDNGVGYHYENLVVCCWDCNQSKGARYSYEEWYGMTEYFRKKAA